MCLCLLYRKFADKYFTYVLIAHNRGTEYILKIVESTICSGLGLLRHRLFFYFFKETKSFIPAKH